MILFFIITKLSQDAVDACDVIDRFQRGTNIGLASNLFKRDV